MKKIILIFVILLISCMVFSEELYRIRIENSPEGLVQVSLDEGKNYSCVGRVKHPANKCGVGFMASGYIEGGTVCAVASHAIRIKIRPKEKYNLDFKSIPIFSILPIEFWTTPKGFGGHVAENSGIYTDIHTASSIFLNFAPFPESKVYQEYMGELYSLSENHIPALGYIYVICVEKPETEIDHIVFENIYGGDVIIDDDRVLTKVSRPVSGIGRYDATTYNSPGQINTAHGGVITIATSKLFPYSQKEGDKPETRGGFMIQPLHHAVRQGENKPQVMTIGEDPNVFEQEGKAPLYSKYINLWYYKDHPEASYYAELRLDDFNYIKMPTITGKVDNGLTKEYLYKHFKLNSKYGVTGVRVHIPKFNRELAEEYLNILNKSYHKNMKGNKSGKFVSKLTMPPGFAAGNYYVDGVYLGTVSDVQGVTVDTSSYSHGLHHFSFMAEEEGRYVALSEYFYVE
ncbi:MAG: hypothetical protein IJS60_01435 [Abditibacteriota bacterium]|nr:hypothetical protein [Abditibacteriota bacterium]